MSYNEHTKKEMKTGVPSDDYLNNFDKIFGKKKGECFAAATGGCFCTGKCKEQEKEEDARNPD